MGRTLQKSSSRNGVISAASDLVQNKPSIQGIPKQNHHHAAVSPQCRLQSAIAQSPRMAAQHKQLSLMFGLPLQRVAYSEARADVGVDNEANLLKWVKAKSASDEEVQWDTFLQDMSLQDVKGRLHDFMNQDALTNSASDYKKYDDLKGMTLYALDDYANTQVDWHAGPDLSTDERNVVRALLIFGRADNLGSCGGMKVEDLKTQWDNVGDETVFFNRLKMYSRAVTTSQPIRLSRTSVVAKAVILGADLLKLQAGFGDVILKGALPEWIFLELARENLADDVVDYYSNVTPTPIFQAKNGRDFLSYKQIKKDDGENPKAYDAGDMHTAIRNYHRFTKTTLDKVKDNYADESKTNPLTLILHTAIDHNGAFHRDPKLDAVVTNGNMHTIMIEGKETLDDVKSQIGPLARKYGKNNKIDQVMIAGHGNARTIELGGKLTKGGELNENEELKEDSDAVDLANNAVKAQALFDEILDNMDIDPGWMTRWFGTPDPQQSHRRILFNACLTNSNYVRDAIDNNNASEARKQIRKYLQDNQNLVGYVESRAKAKNSWDVTVRGSSASHGRLDMIDPSGNLDLISATDPKLTAPKLEYVEFGTEPTGALRAVLECWAAKSSSARSNLQAAMRRRIAKNSKVWRDAIIESLYKLVLNYAWNKGVIIKYLSNMAGELSHAQNSTNCKVGKFGITEQLSAYAQEVFKDLRSANEWAANNYIPLVFYQVWIKMDQGVKPYKEFADHFGAHYDCAAADEFVDISYLAPKMTAILGGGGSAVGKLKLALLGVTQKNNADCKSYLIDLLDKQNMPLTKDQFNPALKIDDLLNGISTEDRILMKIGKKQAPVLDVGGDVDLDVGAASKTGNLTLEGDDQNKYYIDSISKKGKIEKSPKAKVYKKPDTSAAEAGELNKDVPVFVIGVNYDWWAIEYTYGGNRAGTGFVAKADLKLD